MSELIRREDAIALVFQLAITSRTMAAVIAGLAELPTIDAVEVVRCKDCKHYQSDDSMMICELTGVTDENDYCRYGERRDDA